MAYRVALIACDESDVPDWVPGKLEEYGIEFKAKRCSSEQDFLEFAETADAIWTLGPNLVITPESLSRLPDCKVIMRSGSGVDGLPVEEATRLGIWIANTPEAIAETVADHAIALLFAVVRRIPFYDREVREGRWNQAGTDGLRWHFTGQTLGLVGFGQIARHVAQKLIGFKMKTICFDPYVDKDVMKNTGVIPASLNELLEQSDFVSIHCPLNKNTRYLFGEEKLRKMKSTAVLINTSRGAVIDEKALARAIREGWIAGAGLDVTEQEPPRADHPFLELPNVVITPHIAAFSDEFTQKFWECSVAAIRDFQIGRYREHSVNQPSPKSDG